MLSQQELKKIIKWGLGRFSSLKLRARTDLKTQNYLTVKMVGLDYNNRNVNHTETSI